MKRRDFLKTGAAAGAALAVGGVHAQESGSKNQALLARRPYGKKGDRLSVIGFGGIVVVGMNQDEANRIVAQSFERGVNYYDVAPTYGNGEAETKLGPALEPYRKECFLACKTAVRDRAGAEAEFNQSLERLKTDYFDLYQLHAITDVAKDVDAVFADDGVMDMLIEKKKAGQIHHLGFSAHSTAAALAAMNRYGFDSALFPINYGSYFKNGWGKDIIETAQDKGVVCLALKPLARAKWSQGDPKRGEYPKCWYEPIVDEGEASMALRWTLSQPVAAAIPPAEAKLYLAALDIAQGSLDISEEEMEKLRAASKDLDALFPVV